MEKQTIQNSSDYRKIIDDWKRETCYFDGILSVDEMVEMLTNMSFGTAETQVIIASLMACGAKFKTNNKSEYIISFSFDKSDTSKYAMSGYANSALEFAKEEMVDGYEIYNNSVYDEVIVKYPEKTYLPEKTYFIFKK